MTDDGPGRADPDDPPDGNGPSDGTPPGVRDGRPDDLSALLRIQAVSLPAPSPAFLRTGLRAGLVLVAEPLPGDRAVPSRSAPDTVDLRPGPPGSRRSDPPSSRRSDPPSSRRSDPPSSRRSDPTGPPRPDPVGYLLHTVDDRTVYLAELAVAPDHRRRGHASRLVEALAVRHADRGELRLTTRRSNEAALALYERLGFRVERRLPEHYEAGTDAGGSETSTEDGVLLVRDL